MKKNFSKQLFVAIKQFFEDILQSHMDPLGKMHELGCIIFEEYQAERPLLKIADKKDAKNFPWLFKDKLILFDRYLLDGSKIFSNVEDGFSELKEYDFQPTFFYRALFAAFMSIVFIDKKKRKEKNDD